MSDFNRTRLKHAIPSWVRDGEIYFITANLVPRYVNQLAHPTAAQVIREALQTYNDFNKVAS